MSTKELPPTTAVDKTAFSVFGSGHEDSTEILKTVQAVQMKKAQRRLSKDKLDKTDPTKAPTSPETLIIHTTIPHPIWSFFSARKMRMTVTENSKLAVQSASFGPLASITPNESSEDLTKESGRHYQRRYSKIQGDEIEDSFNTEEILQKFNNSMLLHKPKGFNLYESSLSDDECSKTTTKPFMNKYLRRRMSASDITKLDPAKSLTVSAISNESDPASSLSADPNPNLVSRYLGRRGSAGTILASITGSGAIVEKSENTPSSTSSALVPASSTAVMPAKVPSGLDLPESSVAPKPKLSSGFSLLSKTRQFGAWLTKATEGEKVEVTRQDLNAVAPTSF